MRAALILVVCFAGGAAATPPEVVLESCRAAITTGRYPLALIECRAAVAANPGDPRPVCNLASGHRMLGSLERALDLFGRCHREASAHPSTQAYAQAQMGEVRQELRVTHQAIEVVSRPPAVLRIVGAAGPGLMTPAVVWLRFGVHTAELRSADREPMRFDITARDGSQRRIDVSLEPRVRTGTMDVQTRPPGAQLIVDGDTLGTTPRRGIQLAEGTYRVRLVLPGFAEAEHEVSLVAGKTVTLDVELQSPQPVAPPPRLGPLITLGSGGLFAVVGFVFHMVTLSEIQTLEELPDGADYASRYEEHSSRAETLRGLMIGGYALSLAAIVLGTSWYLIGEPEARSEPPGPSIGPGGVRMRF